MAERRLSLPAASCSVLVLSNPNLPFHPPSPSPFLPAAPTGALTAAKWHHLPLNTPSTIPRISRLPFLRTGHSSRDTKAYITRPPPDDTPFTTLWTFFFLSIKTLTLEPQHLIFSVAITHHQNAYLNVTFVSNHARTLLCPHSTFLLRA